MIELAEADCPIEGRSRVPRGLGDRILCTQHRRNNACDGDSGGPLVQQDENGQDVLMGVFSSSPSPCSGNKTALFVRVSSELKWIEEIVWPK
ncbi:hypothetical protein R5R35_008401 [Gryllus longicercus]|uniref:Peptidase S1 domain-containing protein n=1 Tax=Gryllus longicercus TaxID=2509291 RepID=A0AAN9W159_9ORTH